MENSQARDLAPNPRNAEVEAVTAHSFEPDLTCSIKVVRAISDNLLAAWSVTRDRQRERRLRKVDADNRAKVVAAVFANLAFAVRYSKGSFGVSLRASNQKLSRYDRPGFRMVPEVLRLLEAPEGGSVLTLKLSGFRGTLSTVTAAPWFAELVGGLKPSPGDFSIAEGGETIILTRVERDYAGQLGGTREWIDYKETAETLRLRAEMERINAALATADIAFVDRRPPLVALSQSRLRRYFSLPANAPPGTERFDLNGRLFGGWWQSLPKERRQSIHIEGEPIADLDFSSMFLRLAYVAAGHAPPGGDLYASLDGLSELRWRPAVKMVVSAMLFRTTPLTKLPRATREHLPPGTSGVRMRAAILAAHPALSGVFESGIGLRLMFTESQILVAALLAFAEAGITALPMHDGVMVAASKADKAQAVLADTSERVTGGYRLPVHLKTA